MRRKNAARRRTTRLAPRDSSAATLRTDFRRQWEEWLESNRRLEAKLDHYRALYDHAPIGYAILDRSGTILDVNLTAAALLGTGPRAAVGKPLIVFVTRTHSRDLLRHLARCRAGYDNVSTDLLVGRDDTAVAVKLLSRRAWVSGAGVVFHTVITDNRTQMEAERALRESEKRYREIVETANEGICLLDTDYRISFVNRRFATMLRNTPERLLGSSVLNLLLDTDGGDPVDRPASLVRLTERRVRRGDGTFFWAAVSLTTMIDAAANMSGYLLMLTDISDRKNLEATREKLVLRLVSAQEEERRRVSRELHDQLGQHVTGLILGLNHLEQMTDRPESAELIRKLRQLANDISRDAHHLALELRPAALDDLGLATAVSNYADDVARRASLDVDVHCDLNVRLDPAIETTVYRVIQEALTNVVKHARAKHVSVILERQDGAVRAIVEDDGVGFRADKLNARGQGDARLGLVGMRERAALVGGELEIESRPGKGTTLFVRVPVKGGERGHEETPIVAGR